MFSIKSRKCQEPPRTDKSQTPTNADLQSTYYSTLSTKLDTPRRTLPTIRGRRCSRRMAHSDILCVYIWQLIFCFRTRIYGSPYENTFFLTFINPEHVIYDIGTEILCKTCFGHNSTQNAPKSINPVRFYTVFCVDSESAIKTRFKALFKNWPSWIRCYRFL